MSTPNTLEACTLGFFLAGLAATVIAEQLVKLLTHSMLFALVTGILLGVPVYLTWRWMRAVTAN